jgi:hypothetical protein
VKPGSWPLEEEGRWYPDVSVVNLFFFVTEVRARQVKPFFSG